MAVVYFDSSAFVKLLVDEPGTPSAARLWDTADVIASGAITYPEVRAALAAAHRDGRVRDSDFDRARASWKLAWSSVAIVRPTESVLRHAGDLAERHALRGYDAVHLASALALADTEVIVAAWDHRLRNGASDGGLMVAPAEV